MNQLAGKVDKAWDDQGSNLIATAWEGEHFMNGLSGRTILVIDDERYITTTLSLKLRQCGATVLIAHDGREGFSMAVAHRPDMICTGYEMPLMCGLTLAEKLRATPVTSLTPMIMLTARGHRIELQSLMKTNVRGVLAKPFSAREVLAKLEEISWEREAA